MHRTAWEDLPDSVRAAVEDRTGPVSAAEIHEQGLTCATALTLHTPSGPHFLKGNRDTDEGATALDVEERVNPWTRDVGPQIRHSVRASGWRALLFDHIDGRNANLAPGSSDLRAVAAALTAMGRPRQPGVRGVELLADRLGPHLTAAERDLLTGEHLLHTDTNPHNLMADRGGRVHVVDWAMPALGPRWVDAAYTAVRLLEDGHDEGSAAAWLSGVEPWRAATPAGVAALVAGTCRQWAATVGEAAAQPSNTRFRALPRMLVGIPA